MPQEVVSFVHGTTVGINTIIQRKGSRLALITTAGFEDVIELARLRMPDMYSLFCARPEQLIPRDLIYGVRQRQLANGEVAEALDRTALAEVVAQIRARGVDGVIVSFLHAYRNGAHEAEAKALIAEIAPELFVFTSSEVWPVIREYERTTTAILNGYVHPRVAGYLDGAGKRARVARRAGRADADQVQWRGDECRDRQARLRQHAALGHGLRRHRRGLSCRAGRRSATC